MLRDTLSQLEDRIEKSGSIQSENKTELLKLLDTLKSEVAELSATHQEEARSIAGFMEISTHEATRANKNPELLKLSIEGLSSSVDEFEKSHPKLVQVVNRICTSLSNLGI